LEKTVKNRISVGGSVCLRRLGFCPQTLALLLSPTVTALSSSFLALNVLYSPQKEQNSYSKRSVFASPTLLHLFFILNPVVFVDRGRKNISFPKEQGTLATPLPVSVRQV